MGSETQDALIGALNQLWEDGLRCGRPSLELRQVYNVDLLTDGLVSEQKDKLLEREGYVLFFMCENCPDIFYWLEEEGEYMLLFRGLGAFRRETHCFNIPKAEWLKRHEIVERKV